VPGGNRADPALPGLLPGLTICVAVALPQRRLQKFAGEIRGISTTNS